jgi:hypothetical protein
MGIVEALEEWRWRLLTMCKHGGGGDVKVPIGN